MHGLSAPFRFGLLCWLLLFALQVKISDQTYSIGAFLGKDPEDVKHQKQEKLSQQIVDVSPPTMCLRFHVAQLVQVLSFCWDTLVLRKSEFVS